MSDTTEPSAAVELHDAASQPVEWRGYAVECTPLKGASKRADWLVRQADVVTASADEHFVGMLRDFFAQMDAEIDRHQSDPIATTSALLRIETLLGDLRYLRDRLNAVTAASLAAQGVRKLAIEHDGVVEASSSIKRTNWEHRRVMTNLLGRSGWKFIDDDGVVAPAEVLAESLLAYFTPDWKLTALREVGIEPNDYCTIERDEQDRIVKTPSVRIIDNRIKGRR